VPQPTTPSTPAGLFALRLTETTARISWNAASGATSYRIERHTGTTWGSPTTVTSTSTTVSDITTGTRFRITAVNNVGSSQSVEVTVPALLPPNAPASLTYRGIGAEERVTISWNASNIPATYRVQFNNGSGWTDVQEYNGTSTSFESAVSDGIRFRVQAFNSAGDSAWTETVIVYSAPVFAVQLSSQTVNIDSNIIFTANASGFPGHTYQWQSYSINDTAWINIPGETDDTLTLENINYNMRNTRYRVVAENALGRTTSNVAALYVNPARVTFTAQPENIMVTEGQAAAFNVTASGTETVVYQWQVLPNTCNLWQDIPGATSDTLSLGDVSLDMDMYRYRVIAIADGGYAISQIADLEVVLDGSRPEIITHPEIYKIATVGDTITFTAEAAGEPAPSYQWQVFTPDGDIWQDITGASGSALTLTNVQSDMHHNSYRVVASNKGGFARSDITRLAVIAPVAPPPQPTELHAIGIANEGIRIFWTAVPCADFYRVRHIQNDEWTDFLEYDQNSGNLFFETTSQAGIHFRVSAVNAAGESDYTEVTYTPADPNEPPATPCGFTRDTETGRVYWTPVNGAVEYRVFQYGPHDWRQSWLWFYAEVARTENPFYDGVWREQYGVIAVNAAGLESTMGGFEPRWLPSPETRGIPSPDDLTGLSGMMLKDGGSLITWNPARGADSYSFGQRWWSVVQTNPSIIYDTFSEVSWWDFIAWYYVNPRSAAGLSGGGSLWRDDMTPLPRPILPNTPVITGARMIDEGTARISWEPVDYADSYSIGWGATLNTFADAFIGTHSSVQVRAVNESGSSFGAGISHTDVLPLLPPLPVPVSPAALSVRNLQDTDYTKIFWDTSFGADSYEIQLQCSSGWGNIISTKHTSFGISGLTDVTAVQVRAVNATGESAWTTWTRKGLHGDADGDGRITSADATLIARYLIDHNVSIDLRAADINCDGEVTLEDLTRLAGVLVGRYPTLCPDGGCTQCNN